MKSTQDLRRLLESIDRKGYPAYRGTRGSYDFADYVLSIDHAQGDLLASPSKLSIFILLQRAAYPSGYFDTPHRQTVLEDCLVKQFCREITKYNFKAKSSGKSGLIAASHPGPKILGRTACECGTKSITARFEASFLANDRTTSSGKLIKILFDFLPRCIKTVFYYKNRLIREIKAVSDLAEDQHFIRRELERLGLVSFVADGTILPRESNVSSRPMKGSMPFQSPDSLEVELNLPHHSRITGMGLHRSIALIADGGYHGKSTLLKTLESGVYNHVVGDGREYVITDSTAMKLRAEDGGSVQNVDISLFVDNLPNKKNTHCFSTGDASGSTSQVAAVVEGIETGSRIFLIDEDTSAIDFMARDDLMQRITDRAQEPITPFIEGARGLYERSGISTIMVVGSSGAYFYIADTILQMNCCEPLDITDKTKIFCSAYGVEPITSAPGFLPPSGERRPINNKVDSQAVSRNFAAASRGSYKGKGTLGGSRDEHIRVRVYGRDFLQIDKSPVDLRFVEQLIDTEQISTLAQVLRYYVEHQLLERYTVRDTVSMLFKEVQKGRLATVGGNSYTVYSLSMPRIQEIYTCINRYCN